MKQQVFDYCYSPETALSYARFLETIPYILPCKFCRASLTDYYRQHPYSIDTLIINGKKDMDPTLNMKRWMYTIHKCVNAKLKSQGLSVAPNPPFSQVKKTYTNLLKCSWEQQLQLCWDFLFAVGYHHPKEKALYAKPIPECPKEAYDCKDPYEKNKWNVLPLKDRIEWFERFWSYLPVILPKEVQEHWRKVEKTNPPTLACRASTLNWLWRMRCGLDAHFKDPYTSICKRIATYSSDCGKSNRSVTCRLSTSRSSKKKTCKKRK
jgi:hypothetical protein